MMLHVNLLTKSLLTVGFLLSCSSVQAMDSTMDTTQEMSHIKTMSSSCPAQPSNKGGKTMTLTVGQLETIRKLASGSYRHSSKVLLSGDLYICSDLCPRNKTNPLPASLEVELTGTSNSDGAFYFYYTDTDTTRYGWYLLPIKVYTIN